MIVHGKRQRTAKRKQAVRCFTVLRACQSVTVKPVFAGSANVLNDFHDFCGSTITKTERTAIFSAVCSVFSVYPCHPRIFPSPQYSCLIFLFSSFFNCVRGHSLYDSSVSFPLILWDDLQVLQERYTKNGVAGQQFSAGVYVANKHQYYANSNIYS